MTFNSKNRFNRVRAPFVTRRSFRGANFSVFIALISLSFFFIQCAGINELGLDPATIYEIDQTEISLTEGESASVKIRPVSALPAGGRTTIEISAGCFDESIDERVGISQNSLTFSQEGETTAEEEEENEEGWQEVIITALDNHSVDGGLECEVSFSSTAPGDDGSSSETSVGSVQLNISDNDTAGVTINQLPDAIREDGQYSYQVVLDSEPTSDVAIDVTSDHAEFVVSPSTLTFISTEWNLPQSVNIITQDNNYVGNYSVNLSHEISSSDDDNYPTSLEIAPAALSVTDNDSPSVTLSHSSLTMDESGAGNSAVYIISLGALPVLNEQVTVDISVASNHVTLNPTQVTLTSDIVSQSITVTAVDDMIDNVVDRDAVINHRVNQNLTTSLPYNSLSISGTLGATLTDDDTAGVTVSLSDLCLTEGNMDGYTITLDSEPLGNVVININETFQELETQPSSLTFTPINWSMSQTVNVLTQENTRDGDDTVNISHEIAASDNGRYLTSTVINSVDVVVKDNDTPGVAITRSSLTLGESGAGNSDSYDISLTLSPTAGDQVTVDIMGIDSNIIVNPQRVTLTDTSPATITVTAVDDFVDNPIDRSVTLTYSIDQDATATTSSLYDSSVSVDDETVVTITDDDTAGVVFSRASLSLDEGESMELTARLNSQPVSDVTLTLTIPTAHANDLTLNGSSTTINLIFTPSNWDQEQSVDIAAIDDSTTEGTESILIQVSAGSYVSNVAPFMVNLSDESYNLILATGTGHTCALRGNTVKCWGYNRYGQLGNGTSGDANNSNTPVNVVGLSGVIQIVTGENHSCVLLSSGSMKCWGRNSYGQLGDGTSGDNGDRDQHNRSTPVSVSGISNAIQIAAGARHTCALLTGGAVKCWGSNSGAGWLDPNGEQLGDGTTDDSAAPVDVIIDRDTRDRLLGAKQISAGLIHTCALMNAGTIKCWGNNNGGQLGDGTGASSFIPQDVLAVRTDTSDPDAVPVLLSNVKQITTGEYHTCAILNSGSAKCWGGGGANLGDGDPNPPAEVSIPVDVAGISDIKEISAGAFHTCALLRDGLVKCWGYNGSAGRIGDGTTETRLLPTPVSDLSNVKHISAGVSHSCALLTDDSIQCWGDNRYGRLGDGTNTDRYTPVSVSGL